MNKPQKQWRSCHKRSFVNRMSPDFTARTASFHTTRWTRVCAAKSDSDEGRRALADLCDAYYEPVITFLRCELRDADAARDMAHAFFADILAGGAILSADPVKGRFRSYLLGAVKHFLAHQRDAWRRKKRGGGSEHLALEQEEALQVADRRQPAPDQDFDRQWAVVVLRRALDALRAECVVEGKSEIFDKLQPWLNGEAVQGDQVELATTLGMNLNSLKSHVHRLKQRFRHHVKAEIAGTLAETSSVDEELAALLACLRRS